MACRTTAGLASTDSREEKPFKIESGRPVKPVKFFPVELRSPPSPSLLNKKRKALNEEDFSNLSQYYHVCPTQETITFKNGCLPGCPSRRSSLKLIVATLHDHGRSLAGVYTIRGIAAAPVEERRWSHMSNRAFKSQAGALR